MESVISEAVFVRAFMDLIENAPTPWGEALQAGAEFDYMRGRADVVALSREGQVVAFEAKLRKWRYALHQAHRNKCFAELSYVLLPPDEARRAARRRHEFERRDVGLCAFDGVELSILIEASITEPVQTWLSDDVVAFVVREPEAVA